MYEKEISGFKLKALNKITKKYGLSIQYVKQCVKGERKNEIADFIFKDYLKLKEELKNTS